MIAIRRDRSENEIAESLFSAVVSSTVFFFVFSVRFSLFSSYLLCTTHHFFSFLPSFLLAFLLSLLFFLFLAESHYFLQRAYLCVRVCLHAPSERTTLTLTPSLFQTFILCPIFNVNTEKCRLVYSTYTLFTSIVALLLCTVANRTFLMPYLDGLRHLFVVATTVVWRFALLTT